MLLANVTDQLTDVSSVDVMIARVVGVVLAIIIAALVLLLLALFRKVRMMASTLGQPPAADKADDDTTIAAMTSLSVDQGNEILAALKFANTLNAAHFAEIDQVLAERGPIIDRLVTDVDDLKATRHDQGERIGLVETDVATIKARLESATCLPITPTTPSTGG